MCSIIQLNTGIFSALKSLPKYILIHTAITTCARERVRGPESGAGCGGRAGGGGGGGGGGVEREREGGERTDLNRGKRNGEKGRKQSEKEDEIE